MYLNKIVSPWNTWSLPQARFGDTEVFVCIVCLIFQEFFDLSFLRIYWCGTWSGGAEVRAGCEPWKQRPRSFQPLGDSQAGAAGAGVCTQCQSAQNQPGEDIQHFWGTFMILWNLQIMFKYMSLFSLKTQIKQEQHCVNLEHRKWVKGNNKPCLKMDFWRDMARN